MKRIILPAIVLAALPVITCASHAASEYLQAVDSGITSPTGHYRWLNIAYQVKLVGTPGTPENERIGLTGRWWQEQWDGSKWTGGSNLNNKGDGSSPNPNELTYFARRDIPDTTSPTGKRYRYTGYLLSGIIVTDSYGNAEVDFSADSSYHVVWKTSQRTPDGNDGPVETSQFNPDPSMPGYDIDYDTVTVSVYGEWERLPNGGVHLNTGAYTCQLILTEESFHGSGGQYAGNWAAAMGADIRFAIVPELRLSGFENGLCHLSWLPAGRYTLQCASSPDFAAINDTVAIGDTITEYYHAVGETATKAFFKLTPSVP